jgi:1,4-dihydroxy-2-naphthoyl-CoA hydrolase
MSDALKGFRPLSQTFERTIGLEVVDHGDDFVRGRMPVEERILQPYGIVHGGALCALAESLASMGTAVAVAEEGKVAMGQELNVSYMRPVTGGHVNALARARRKGRTAWNWDVEITDDNDRLCALLRLTIAVRDAPERRLPTQQA